MPVHGFGTVEPAHGFGTVCPSIGLDYATRTTKINVNMEISATTGEGTPQLSKTCRLKTSGGVKMGDCCDGQKKVAPTMTWRVTLETPTSPLASGELLLGVTSGAPNWGFNNSKVWNHLRDSPIQLVSLVNVTCRNSQPVTKQLEPP